MATDITHLRALINAERDADAAVKDALKVFGTSNGSNASVDALNVAALDHGAAQGALMAASAGLLAALDELEALRAVAQ